MDIECASRIAMRCLIELTHSPFAQFSIAILILLFVGLSVRKLQSPCSEFRTHSYSVGLREAK
ncbi:hypothetical protein, partial [Caballeronia sp.]|uniref:hypothetical protein n=1 Tax=Caballeronia sp. TaxID=1931223 RepID=UPI003C493147